MCLPKERVVVGMSGGVDSSVAAWLLLRQGYEVIGVTMRIWQDESPDQVQANNGCCGLSAVDDARRVANVLGIPYYVLNFKDVFKSAVMDYFAAEYLRGRTPNPCIACNRYVKWEALLNKALQLGAGYIATGHYARVSRHPDTGRLCLKYSATEQKDQTYALYALTQAQLAHTLTPCGDYTKDAIRGIARDNGLPVADKPDSQEICFIPDKDYARFIEEYTSAEARPGPFLNEDGREIGRHKGIFRYTIGQRKGLGTFGKPMYVKRIDPERNTVTLADNSALACGEFEAESLNWMGLEPFEGERRLTCKIRYSHRAAACTVTAEGPDRLKCCFDEPQRAITPGQAAVFYDGPYIACGGTIT
jgi:tRNA-specific 2-thiouridylase